MQIIDEKTASFHEQTSKNSLSIFPQSNSIFNSMNTLLVGCYSCSIDLIIFYAHFLMWQPFPFVSFLFFLIFSKTFFMQSFFFCGLNRPSNSYVGNVCHLCLKKGSRKTELLNSIWIAVHTANRICTKDASE